MYTLICAIMGTIDKGVIDQRVTSFYLHPNMSCSVIKQYLSFRLNVCMDVLFLPSALTLIQCGL